MYIFDIGVCQISSEKCLASLYIYVYVLVNGIIMPPLAVCCSILLMSKEIMRSRRVDTYTNSYIHKYTDIQVYICWYMN